MALTFERGDSNSPKGHALIYFINNSDHEDIWATYLVLLPIHVDLGKYVPPFLMNQIEDSAPNDLSAFAFPPAPEQVDSLDQIMELANMREDDIIFGGEISINEASENMMKVNSSLEEYIELYSKSSYDSLSIDRDLPAYENNLEVKNVMYGMMSEPDKLNELTKLIGKLTFANESNEPTLAKEAEEEISLLSTHMPIHNRISSIVDAAKHGGPIGSAKAELLLKRCYHLAQENYAEVGKVEQDIKALDAESN